jgi:putative acetyltransferase
VVLPEVPTFDIRRAAAVADWRHAAALIHDHIEWMRVWAAIEPLTEQPALTAELRALPEHYGPGSDGAMFLAMRGDVAVGCVAVRVHDGGDAEVKRMFVRPTARGKGIGDQLVAAAVEHAAARGCDTVWLETMRGAMDAAITVYGRHGFVPAGRPATIDVEGVVVLERRIGVSVGGTCVERCQMSTEGHS